MIGRLIRFVFRSGLRWFILTLLGRVVARWVGARTVARATTELEARAERHLPESVARTVVALPDEAKQAAGTALVAGRAARTAARTSSRVVKGTAGASRQVARAVSSTGGGLSQARHLVDDVRDQVRAETEASSRRLKAQYLGTMVGPEAEFDAMLDRRFDPDVDGDAGLSVDDLHEAVPEPVSRGRRRARKPLLGRPQRRSRRYQPPTKPWD
ncbi:MAG: hypothetical protein AAF467_25295 [Actinomycetota bacterium]